MKPLLFLLASTLLAAIPAQVPLPPERTGLLYVSGYSSSNVGEYLPDGTLLRTITHPTMTQPRGIAMESSGALVVVCQGSQRILRLDLEGNLLQTVTHPDLTQGTGISQDAAGNWYVGNFSPGRVLVFDPAWNHQQTITVTGMNGVNCVSFDFGGAGTWAVTAAFTNQVFRFDAGGSLLGTTTHPNLSSPMSIAQDSLGNHYVSGGSSNAVVKFDASWNPLQVIGQGLVNGPQGIAVDEQDRLTISNFYINTVHRFDTAGQLLGSWPLNGVNVGRNIAWQIRDYVLARRGTVRDAAGNPTAVLTANGSAGDSMGRLTSGAFQAFQLDLAAAPAGPAGTPYLLYLLAGEPGPSDVELLPYGLGPFAFATPLGTGPSLAVPLVNSLGGEALLGSGLLPPLTAPGAVLSLPFGPGLATTLTLQAILPDLGAAPGFATSNALVVTFL